MERLFYSTGQVARQLGTTLATIRALCENHVIAAETTPGGQWRVSASEVDRLKRDGLPPIPRPLPVERALVTTNGTSHHDDPENWPQPSDEVQSAEDRVAITRSTLETRKIDREIEENEDWFRERRRQKAAAAAAERQKAEAKQAELQHQQWIERWAQYALDSVPSVARGEVEIEVHTAVDGALSKLQASQPDSITRALVDAAVRRALRPWTRKQELERAVRSAINKLPWAVRNLDEHAQLKQRASDAAVEALRRLREEASGSEIETAAIQAVQPMIHEYEHRQACQRIVQNVYLFSATTEEQEAAKEAVQRALASLPIGATRRELEKAEEDALAPYKAAIAQRKEKARLESEMQARRHTAELRVIFAIDHILRYLEKEYEFHGGDAEMRRTADRLRPGSGRR